MSNYAGGTVELKVRCHSDQGYLFEVIDSGIGIAAENIAKALQPFGQIDSALNRQHTGTGLGLPLAKELTEMHGGTLEIDSEPGVGTKVTVGFPSQRTVRMPDDPRWAKKPDVTS